MFLLILMMSMFHSVDAVICDSMLCTLYNQCGAFDLFILADQASMTSHSSLCTLTLM